MFQVALTGLLTGLALIVAVGAQNAFLLRQGIRGEHVLPIVLTCLLSDVVAITAGKLHLGPWEHIFYYEFDGRRKKRILVKIIGE